MNNRKTTKKALLMSALSLLLCFSMLIGTTFAWFTDEVKSGTNQILAGNLDVEVYNSLTVGHNKVTESTKLFDSVTYWEPGMLAYENLTIANLGTLALKYQLSVNFTNATTNAKDETLAEVLKVGFVKGGIEENASRADALTKVSQWLPLASFTQSGKLDTAKDLLVDAETADTYAIVIYWQPSDKDNDFNMNNGSDKVMSIDLGIKLFATQLTAENDSFGYDYDEEAAVFTVEDANKLLEKNKDVTLVDCHEPDAILYVPAGYTGTLTLYNVSIASVQETAAMLIDDEAVAPAAGITNIVIEGNVVVKAIADNMSAITGTKLNITGNGNLIAIANGLHAYGIGGDNTQSISIKGIRILDVKGGVVQPNFVNDTKYGKSEPEGGAAIGSGFDGAVISLEKVTIEKAEGGSKAAAIGARYWTGVTINITDCTIKKAVGGNASAAIGGSRISDDQYESGVIINIVNSTIYAQGGEYGAGIGSGYDTHCQSKQPLCTINISDSTINAVGGKYAAGVGTGYHHAALAGEIKNSTMNAVSGEKWYKNTYTAAMDIGFGVTDPAREGTQTGSKIVFDGASLEIENAPVWTEIENGLYYDAAKTSYMITNANGLKAVADIVNATTPYTATIFDGVPVLLTCDIDLGGMEWIPIGDDRSQRTEFHGIFDGQGHTVSNFKITKKTDREDENKSSYGLFGNVKGTVKNLTVANASISGAPKFIGVLVGRLNDGLIENCHVINSQVSCNNWTIGGLVGQWNNGVITGCSVKNTVITGYAAVGAIAGIALNSGERTLSNCVVEGCALVQNGSFGGSYDKMFGAVVGALYSGTLKVSIEGCEVKNNSLNGFAFNTVCGYISEGDNLIVDGKQYAIASTLAEVMALAKKGNTIIDAKGANLGDYNYSGTFANGTVLKNAKFTYVYGASVDGVATFENCQFVSDHSYSANFSDGSYTGKVIFNNCYFDGWNSFGTAITSVEMNNCVFETVIGPYSLLRFYQNAVLNNCEIKASFDGIDTNKAGTVVELNNCTGIEGKIYNNTDNGVVQVGKWIVNGVELTDVPAW